MGHRPQAVRSTEAEGTATGTVPRTFGTPGTGGSRAPPSSDPTRTLPRLPRSYAPQRIGRHHEYPRGTQCVRNQHPGPSGQEGGGVFCVFGGVVRCKGVGIECAASSLAVLLGGVQRGASVGCAVVCRGVPFGAAPCPAMTPRASRRVPSSLPRAPCPLPSVGTGAVSSAGKPECLQFPFFGARPTVPQQRRHHRRVGGEV